MTTTKSYSNKNLFFSSYKNALIKIRGISFIYFIFSILLFPAMLLMQVSRYKNDVADMIKINNIYHNYPNLNGLIKIYPDTILFYAVLLIGSAILMSILVNEYMLNKKQVDVYHSLPVKRETMFLANFSAVATVLIVPIVICYIIAMLANVSILNTIESIGIANPQFEIMYEDVKTMEIVKDMLATIIIVLTMEAITFFSCVCSCSVFDSVVFSLSLTEIVPLFMATVSLILNSFVKGYVIQEKLMYYGVYTSPINILFSRLCLNFPIGGNKSSDILVNMTIAQLLIATVILIIGLLIYRRRKSESAQNYDISGFLYKFIMAVAVFGLSVISGILTSIFAFENADHSVIFSLIYGILYFFVLQSIFTRSVKLNIKNPILLAICAISAPALLIFAQHGWFGYEKYIPKQEDVKSVSVNYKGKYDNISVFNAKDGRMGEDIKAVFTDKEIINDLMEIHKHKIYDDETEIHTYGETEKEYVSIRNQFFIEYELKSGRKVARQYSPNMFVQDAQILFDLNSSDEFKQSLCPVLFDHKNLPTSLNIYNRYGEDMVTMDIKFSKENIELIYDAMAKDIINETAKSDAEDKGDVVCIIIPSYYENGAEIIYEGLNYRITENHVNTLNALKKAGLKEEDFEKISDKNRLVISYPYIHSETYAMNMGYRYVPDYVYGYDTIAMEQEAATTEEFILITAEEDVIKDLLAKTKQAKYPNKYSCILSVGPKERSFNYYIDVEDLPEEIKVKAVDFINSNYYN